MFRHYIKIVVFEFAMGNNEYKGVREKLLIRLEPKLKEKIKKLAKAERRDMNSYVCILFENKIKGLENARTN